MKWLSIFQDLLATLCALHPQSARTNAQWTLKLITGTDDLQFTFPVQEYNKNAHNYSFDFRNFYRSLNQYSHWMRAKARKRTWIGRLSTKERQLFLTWVFCVILFDGYFIPGKCYSAFWIVVLEKAIFLHRIKKILGSWPWSRRLSHS